MKVVLERERTVEPLGIARENGKIQHAGDPSQTVMA
jgi:hypothetical protein